MNTPSIVEWIAGRVNDTDNGWKEIYQKVFRYKNNNGIFETQFMTWINETTDYNLRDSFYGLINWVDWIRSHKN